MFTLLPSTITDTTIIQQLPASLNKTNIIYSFFYVFPRKLRDGYCIIKRCKWWGTYRSEFLKPFVGSMCLSSFPLTSSRVNIHFIRRISRKLHPDYGIPCFPTCRRQLPLHGHELWNKDGRESIEFLPDNHSLILRTYPRPLKRETERTNCFLRLNMQSKCFAKLPLSERNDKQTTDGILCVPSRR